MATCVHNFTEYINSYGIDTLCCIECGYIKETSNFECNYSDFTRCNSYTKVDTSLHNDIVNKGINSEEFPLRFIPNPVIELANSYYENVNAQRTMKTKINKDIPSNRLKFMYACIYLAYMNLDIPILIGILAEKLTTSDNLDEIKETTKIIKSGLKELSYYMDTNKTVSPTSYIKYFLELCEITEEETEVNEVEKIYVRYSKDLEFNLENLTLAEILISIIYLYLGKKYYENKTMLLQRTGVTMVTVNKVKKIIA